MDKKLKLAQKVLVEFVQFERSLGMKHVDIVYLIEAVLKLSNAQNQVSKSELQKTYNKMERVSLS